jgi:hypothetical protein
MRIRGSLVSWVDAAQAVAGNVVRVALGIAPVMEGQGTTVVWSPITDSNAPWMYYEQWVFGYEEMVVDVIDIPGITSYRSVIDVKAQRILRPDVEMQIVIESSTIGGSGLVTNTFFSTRTLLGQK